MWRVMQLCWQLRRLRTKLQFYMQKKQTRMVAKWTGSQGHQYCVGSHLHRMHCTKLARASCNQDIPPITPLAACVFITGRRESFRVFCCCQIYYECGFWALS